MSTEEWRPVVGLPGYEASSLGRIRSWLARKPEPRILTLSMSLKGYQVVNTKSPTGTWRVRTVHSLVLMAFRGPRPESASDVRHLNGVRTDNRIRNLKWGTSLENAADTRRHVTHRNARKTHCKNGHEFTPENTRLALARTGRPTRVCIACKRAHSQARRAGRIETRVQKAAA